MTRVLLIRHGETSWNREQRWQGQADVPLSDEGIEQARRLASYLSRDAGAAIRAVYSSDLQRASQTADVLARFKHFGFSGGLLFHNGPVVRLVPRARETPLASRGDTSLATGSP